MGDDPEETYLAIHERFSVFQDQLGDTAEGVKKSSLAEHAEVAVSFALGVVASGILDRLTDAAAKRLEDLLRKSRGRKVQGSPVDAIQVIIEIKGGVPDLSHPKRVALTEQLYRGLIDRGFQQRTAELLADEVINRLWPEDGANE